MSRTIERSVEVPVPLERVWQVMTDPAELNRWYFPFRADPDGRLHTEVHGQERAGEVVDGEALAARALRRRARHRRDARGPAALPAH